MLLKYSFLMLYQNVPEQDLIYLYRDVILHMLISQNVVVCWLKARKGIMSGTANSTDVWETDHKSIEPIVWIGLDENILPCYKDIPV